MRASTRANEARIDEDRRIAEALAHREAADVAVAVAERVRQKKARQAEERAHEMQQADERRRRQAELDTQQARLKCEEAASQAAVSIRSKGLL